MIIKRIQEWKTDSEQIDQHNENDAEMIPLKEDKTKASLEIIYVKVLNLLEFPL